MTFHPCILVPHYNHYAQTAPVLDALNKLGYPVLVVDDGSNKDDICNLEGLVGKLENVDLYKLKTNRGKGAAVLTGFTIAALAGYSHALQVDADGQHDINDIELFLVLSKKHPESIIAGKPIFDSSIPRKRRLGRKITDFWVVIETLSFKFPDAMCGFRVYPLNQTAAVTDRYHIGARMDFDTEILVKSHWSGIPCHFVDTKVIYPENGVSNFQMLEDNIRITKMHTRLATGMLLHLPSMLKRKFGLG